MSADGKVVIQTELDTKQADKQAKGLGGSLKNGITKGAKVATGAMVAIGTASVATAGAFVKATKQTAEYGDHIDKMSQKLGISAKAYQQWDYVAKISGTSIDGLKMGFKTLTNTIDKANQGDEKAIASFQRIGMSIDDLKGKSKEDIFQNTVKSLQKMSDETERSAMANKLLGRAGMELGPMLNSSKGSIDELMKKAEDYGMIMGDKAVKASAKFQDSLTTMQGTFTGLKNRMSAEFLPSLTKVTDGLALVFKGDTKKGLKKIEEGIGEFSKKLNEVTPKFLKLGGTILKALGKGFIDNLPNLLDAGANAITSIIAGIAKAIPILIKKLPQIFKAVKDALIKAFDVLSQELPSALGGLAGVLKNVVDLFGGFLEMLMSSTKQGEILRGIIMALVSAYITYKAVTTLAATATKLLTVAMNTNPFFLLVTAIGAVVGALALFAEGSEKTTSAMDRELQKADEVANKYDEFTKKLEENKKAREENTDKAAAEGEELDFLYGKLVELNKVEHKSKAQKEEMKSIVEQLNEKLPKLKLKYDEEKDSLNKSTNEIKKNIEARKDALMFEALQDNAKSLAQDKANAQIELNKLLAEEKTLQADRQKAYENYKKAKAELDKADPESTLYSEVRQKFKDAESALNGFDERIKTNKNNISDARTKITDLGNQFDQTYQQMANTEQQDVFAKLVKKAKKAGVDVPQSLIDGFNAGTISAKEASERINQAIDFKKMSKKSKSASKETVDNVIKKFQEGEIDFKTASRKLWEAGVDEINPKDFETKSELAIEGFLKAWKSRKTKSGVVKTMGDFVRGALNAIGKAGGEGSPWKTTEQKADYAVDGFVNEIYKRQKDADKAMASLATSSIGAFDKELSANTQYSAGSIQTAISHSVDLQRGVYEAVKLGFEDANVEMKVGERDFARLVKGA